MPYHVSNRKDIETWLENRLDIDNGEAMLIAVAVWNRKDFPHPVNGTDLSEYLDRLDVDWLYEQI
jgi:hypothetical protein